MRRARVAAGMLWATRARPHVDRCGTAWLIRRFIDPKAEFVFVQPGSDVPAGAEAFDMPNVRFGHRGKDCTFETVMKEHKLDKELRRRGDARDGDARRREALPGAAPRRHRRREDATGAQRIEEEAPSEERVTMVTATTKVKLSPWSRRPMARRLLLLVALTLLAGC